MVVSHDLIINRDTVEFHQPSRWGTYQQQWDNDGQQILPTIHIYIIYIYINTHTPILLILYIDICIFNHAIEAPQMNRFGMGKGIA
jgi:hypothetical protein